MDERGTYVSELGGELTWTLPAVQAANTLYGIRAVDARIDLELKLETPS